MSTCATNNRDGGSSRSHASAALLSYSYLARHKQRFFIHNYFKHHKALILTTTAYTYSSGVGQWLGRLPNGRINDLAQASASRLPLLISLITICWTVATGYRAFDGTAEALRTLSWCSCAGLSTVWTTSSRVATGTTRTPANTTATACHGPGTSSSISRETVIAPPADSLGLRPTAWITGLAARAGRTSVVFSLMRARSSRLVSHHTASCHHQHRHAI